MKDDTRNAISQNTTFCTENVKIMFNSYIIYICRFFSGFDLR